SIVGAIDISPELTSQDLGQLFENPTNTGIIITNTPEKLLAETEADVAVITTTSYLPDVKPQIFTCLKAGLNVVSTCEELSYPWKRHPQLAQEIDQEAKQAGKTVVGTGINPGFLMDFLPLTLTSPCLKVNSIKVTRMMNSARRRLPFQKKVGTGLTPEEFQEKISQKIITGHVGLLESINMIADSLHWKLDKAVELPPEPVIAEKPTPTGFGEVEPGKVIGLKSVAYGLQNGRQVIILEFYAYAGVEEEYDEVIVDGVPTIHEKIIGGVHGDIGTVSMTINTIPRTVEALPGLKVMSELPPPVVIP
ncbi:dihydrodipicolinate reductase, partial [Candidatus Aminicenantes bacterium AC-334-K16]|nr:dihydrodipicolinate reductase [Candidatus Aminicenantes bacterium AC-334-K16]